MDRSLTLVEFGRDYLGGLSAKTAKRRVTEEGIPHIVDHGHILIRQSVAENWRESKAANTQPDLRSRLQQIRDRVRARRKAAR